MMLSIYHGVVFATDIETGQKILISIDHPFHFTKINLMPTFLYR